MKKLLAACACTVLSFSMTGCSPGTILEQFTSTGDTSVREIASSTDTTTTTESKDRIYMDELSGILQDFSGSQLILNTDDASYVFNVSNATLECKSGMITGEEISIIYEGQLSGTDTGSVHVLKVVDEFHKKGKQPLIQSQERNNITRTESNPATGYTLHLKENFRTIQMTLLLL